MVVSELIRLRLDCLNEIKACVNGPERFGIVHAFFGRTEVGKPRLGFGARSARYYYFRSLPFLFPNTRNKFLMVF